MAKERPRLSAKRWADQPDSGFVPTTVKLPDGVNSFSPKKEAVYRLEIVPYEVPKVGDAGSNPNAEPGELHYERTYFTHRGIGVDENAYVCPLKTAGKPCPICEHRKELMREKDGDEDLIKELAPKQRQLWNIFDHDDSDKGVQVWDISFHLFGKQLKKEVRNADEGDGYEYFADPEEGFTLRVGLEEKSFGGREFLEAATIGFKPRKSPIPKEVLEAAQPLDNLLIILNYDKLKSIFLQEEGVTPEEKEDEDDRPVKSRPEKEQEEPKQAKQVTAESRGIGKGDDVEWKGESWTVMKVTDDGTTLKLMSDSDVVKSGVPVNEVTLPTKKSSKKEDEAPWDDEKKPEEKTKKPNDNGDDKPAKKEPEKPKKAVEEDDWDKWE